MSSCYNTHSWSSANDATPTSSHCQIIPRLCLHEDSAPTAEPLPPPSSAVPLASLVAHSPLEPLFLGMDDDAVITPLPSLYLAPIVPNPMGNDHSLVSPAIDLYEVNSRCAALEMMTLECQAVWEAELAQSPTPPPAADEVIDTILLAPQAETPCHGPGCSRSRRVTGSYGRSTGIEDLVEISREHGRSAVSMETMDSYGLTCKGGPSTATRRTKLKEQAQPRRGPSSRSMQMVTTQGLERQEPKELTLIKGGGAVSKESTPGHEEEEQCRRS
ncbi:hypothetical protein NDA11_006325 [Ustilago hordei]|nr:hypothetical protein NDA11_006325 [Ustilago hordei]